MHPRSTASAPRHPQRASSGTGDDPLSAASSEQQVVGAISRMAPPADDRSATAAPRRSTTTRHERLQDMRSPATSSAASTASFPVAGFSRTRRRPPSSTQSSPAEAPRRVEQPAAAVPGAGQTAASQQNQQTPQSQLSLPLLPADSLGRKLWQHFQTAPDFADLRTMVADSPTAAIILPQSAAATEGANDLGAALNDNVLFTETPLGAVLGGDDDSATEPQLDVHGAAQCSFTTVSGICGTVGGGAVSALGVLPPMEDIMQSIAHSDSPRATLFDVLDSAGGPPLQLLHVVGCQRLSLPDSRRVLALVVAAPLERSLVVDSAVATLAARTHDAVAALLPRAPPDASVSSDQITADVDEIMRFAHSIELRASAHASPPAAATGLKALAWIAGRRTGSQRTAATATGAKAPADEDGDQWQACMQRLQDHTLDYLARLEDETSACGDAEARRKTSAMLAECVEKLVCESIYARLFSPAGTLSDDSIQDAQFASKIAALNVADIGLGHLGLSAPLARPELERICAEAAQMLCRMDAVKSPAEKLKLIVDAHKCIVDRIQRLNQRLRAKEEEPADTAETSPPKTELAADSILPLLIYAVVKSNPPRFVSNLRFIQRFRTRSLLSSQFEYCMTNAHAVASFVASVDPRHLGLPAEVSAAALEPSSPPPPLAILHNLLVNNVVSSVGLDVMQGVAGGSKKVAVGVYDATLRRLIDSSSLLIANAPWRSPADRELRSPVSGALQHDDGHARDSNEKPDSGADAAAAGVEDPLTTASQQLPYEIKAHLPRNRAFSTRSPRIVDRFLSADPDDLKMGEIAQLLESYKELARYIRE
ncbi:ATP-dependent RNA helicase dbp2 [Coemansia guatemalensis]|uniref:ATP-dependent RNA helicase dbp2 n=1 Tax=Coemansia guatemalensis TaxID=2761395 RepID=A0A9W8HW95_9FUNG|nr:ATP-dependent RNA helicase dbp2 [Coemansia guatemalensis]